MNYYFSEKHEWNRDYFNSVKSFTVTRSDEVETAVLCWIEAEMDHVDPDLYQYFADHSVGKIDVNYEQGIFYYHWMNEYLIKMQSYVWNCELHKCKLFGFDEKAQIKAADTKRDLFIKFCKDNFKK